MLGRRVLAAAAFVLGGLSSATYGQNGAPPLPDQMELGRFGMSRAWHVQIPILTREKLVNLLIHEGSILLDQENELDIEAAKPGKKKDLAAPKQFKRQREALLFAATDHGMLHCLEADTGEIRWSQRVALDGDVTYRPAITNKYVYAVSGTKLLRIDKRSGRTLIDRELPSVATGGPAATEFHVYVPVSKSIWCYEVPDPRQEGKAGLGAGLQGAKFVPDPVDGGKMYNVHTPPGQTRRFQKLPSPWHFTLNVPFNSAPILYKNNVIAVASDGTLTSFRQEFGERTMIHNNGHFVVAPLGQMDHFVYLASSDYAVYCIDIRNGKQLWRFASGFPVMQQPVPFSTEVLIVTDGGGLTAVDNKEGVRIWTNESIRRLVAVSREHVFGADRHHVVQVLSRKNGGVLGSLPLSNFTVSPVNQYNDRLYLASQTGVVLCLNERSSPAPYLHPQTSGIEDEARGERGLAKEVGGKEDVEKKSKPKVVPKPKKKKEEDEPSEDDPPAKGTKGKGKSDAGKGAKGKALKKEEDEG